MTVLLSLPAKRASEMTASGLPMSGSRPNSPLRLPLGNFAYDAMGAEIEAVRKEYAAVEAAARGADYPKEG